MTALELGEGRLQTQAADGQKPEGFRLSRNPEGQLDLDKALDELGYPPLHTFPDIQYISNKSMFTEQERRDLGISEGQRPLLSNLSSLLNFLSNFHL